MFIREEKRGSIILQVIMLFTMCVLLTGLLTYATEYFRASQNVKDQIESLAAQTAREVILAAEEYPAHEWLLGYWHDHADELDIEYDADYTAESKTAEKARILAEHNPDLQLRYAETDEIIKMSAEDQKLYAEIIYSWLITRINQIKQVCSPDYLFCVRTEAPYDRQFFMFSAADPGAERGTEYEQVYTLGVTVSVDKSQQDAMQSAVKNQSYIADAGSYVDYYFVMDTIDGHDYLVGMTFDLAAVTTAVEQQRSSRSVTAMVYQIILSVICAIAIMLVVIRPLKIIQVSIRQYKDEKDSGKVRNLLEHINMNNEIGELSNDVIEMTAEIDDHLDRISRITAERERIGAELGLATDIQRSMLPHVFPPFPNRSEMDLYALMEPAREVGGDFYDFFMVDDDHLCLVIADVSGKGIPAALFMMISKIIIKSCAMLGEGPAGILRKTNEAICEDNQTEMFVTVWVGILELSTGILKAASAGHEYPVIRHPGSRFELYKDQHGFVIGGLEDMEYTEYEVQMQPGSEIFVYTDGVPEASDAENNMFGIQRMLASLNETTDASPEMIIRHVRHSIDMFTRDGTQFDDLTMLCIRYNGKE